MRQTFWVFVAGALTASCQGEGRLEVTGGSDRVGAAISWEQFLARTPQDPISGVFIVDGDVPVEDIKLLREFYNRHVRGRALIVQQVAGVDSKWDETQRRNLTYCVSRDFWDYPTLVSAMKEASAEWEAAADVRFVHLTGEDNDCTHTNPRVLFNVSPGDDSIRSLVGRAFFPHYERPKRSLQLWYDAFQRRENRTLTGVLRHELGHILGFRHEQIRPDAHENWCFEDNDFRILTPYDSESVMHYPHCGGTGDGSLRLTERDIEGAQKLYGPPGGTTGGNPHVPDAGPPSADAGMLASDAGLPSDGGAPPDAGWARHLVEEGSVEKGQTVALGPYHAVAGTTFSVAMSGTGDPDLYLRFGSAPTDGLHHCRPYLTGPVEVCAVEVPASAPNAFIGVKGYEQSSFRLELDYVAPGGPTDGGIIDAGTSPAATEVSGTVNAGEFRLHPPVPVVPGGTLEVVMDGTGDPDLYLRWAVSPTEAEYDCRPYNHGPDERCVMTVPAGVTLLYPAVKGFAAASYRLRFTTRSP